MGSEETDNPLLKDKSMYENISILSDMKSASWEMAKIVDQQLRTTKCHGDWMEALALALNIIHSRTEEGADYNKTQIVFFSPFESPFTSSEETESECISTILQQQTELVFIDSEGSSETKFEAPRNKVVARFIEEVIIIEFN